MPTVAAAVGGSLTFAVPGAAVFGAAPAGATAGMTVSASFALAGAVAGALSVSIAFSVCAVTLAGFGGGGFSCFFAATVAASFPLFPTFPLSAVVRSGDGDRGARQ